MTVSRACQCVMGGNVEGWHMRDDITNYCHIISLPVALVTPTLTSLLHTHFIINYCYEQ